VRPEFSFLHSLLPFYTVIPLYREYGECFCFFAVVAVEGFGCALEYAVKFLPERVVRRNAYHVLVVYAVVFFAVEAESPKPIFFWMALKKDLRVLGLLVGCCPRLCEPC